MKAKVSLSIGFSGCSQDDVIEIDDDELKNCETDEERENLLNEYWKEWSNNYIDGSIDLID